MRIKNKVEDINYDAIQKFYQHRADRFNEQNPYSVTMLQDDNPALVEERNRVEVEKLLPLLCLDSDSKVLDLACGVGRWLDALPETISSYCGIDFSPELIEIAENRNNRKNARFMLGLVTEADKLLTRDKFNRILMLGFLHYLNESDINKMLEQIPSLCENHAILCIRTTIGLSERLTLKDFYSEELKENYNAIYRTRDEFMTLFERTLLKEGFMIREQDFMFPSNLNNRAETAQYYFIFER